MKSADIRSVFLDFFKEREHQIVASSSLVSANDSTLLFTNAGMNQFKETFLGREVRAYSRAVTAQKCVRAGGKHNDLDNVGYTTRHHTFFEMLGNFSFGDYFKREAIFFAWEFLLQKLGLPEEKLWVTVYQGDEEAEDIWLREVGLDASRFSRLGEKDNFWSMGDTGPCGPCSEIFYDHGDHVEGDPPGGANDGDRYVEIWNMVFMQFNRTTDGQLQPLPKPSIDTGMGLERLAAVLQGVHSNYEIDLFQELLKDAANVLGGVATTEASLRVIVDHIRSCSFLLADGVMPANDGRGYTLRRIIRRACRHGHKLGADGVFFYKLVVSLVRVMGDAYPELKEKQGLIERALLQEEEQFIKTLGRGMGLLKEHIAKLTDGIVPGEVAFTLYDTYGFPVDLTQDVAREHNMSVDMASFEVALEAQRQRARKSSKFGMDYNDHLNIEGKTEFNGYEATVGSSVVHRIFVEDEEGVSWRSVDQASIEDKGVLVVVEATPFYAESGGQVGDTGVLRWQGHGVQVINTRKQGEVFMHQLSDLLAPLRVGQMVELLVAQDLRKVISCNHSATHLLHGALRKVLGSEVTQKGSLVDSKRLRFDFSHFEVVKPEELEQVESIVNDQIRANTPIITELMTISEAQSKGALALFGEKYGDEVRVLTMGEDNFSVELCGGIHAGHTGDIGSFRIISESGIASGVRRIEASTGGSADIWTRAQLHELNSVSRYLKTKPEYLLNKVGQLVHNVKDLEKEIAFLKQKLSGQGSSDLMAQVVNVKGVKLLVAALTDGDSESLRGMVDQLKNKLGSGVILLAAPAAGKVSLAAGVTADLTSKVKAGDLVKMVADQVGGKGGGRPDFAQGGGTQPELLPVALESVAGWLEDKA
ncbi:MAG: alanine--tRNA ligase [Candidatus Endonucleobacter bathymodioli]|uniref:Alanine--tRNA ligase n=1 Tax=Candidatus Endonucleibacter bathymodioli TaxID=539814 RepID=A0AA90NMG6_9GAMM|nr:alanine--tRNA ligase [Candidatus Endonucleobacter bathymodioli]